jgi:hypothetical protein
MHVQNFLLKMTDKITQEIWATLNAEHSVYTYILRTYVCGGTMHAETSMLPSVRRTLNS